MRARTIREVMTTDPVSLPRTASLLEAARQMRRRHIGGVLVVGDDGALAGVVTDRDIVVRCVAMGGEAASTSLAEVVSEKVVTIGPDEPVVAAIWLMREHALRRLPVVTEGRAIGIVTLGDLVVVRDPASALASISSFPPNH
ncbi:CBS domain-containing protein [Catellatospora tritici]|uniref:CBS domain-containing protein n=1 Tax=Catellatospora tritici TaxID=2851566 RepID=UPI001C2D63B1|nr:CBS domain-containing protein [Catellatospora tritici]MBV1852752.1 CBS domain-containing protein [Catellatospora tritici]